MTTSITDARFTHLHATPEYILALLADDKPDTTWEHVMPGFDENLGIPAHLEPPRLDSDEVLPSQVHPSYPFGRAAVVKPGHKGTAVNSLLDPQHAQAVWDEFNLNAIVEKPSGKEVPPVMAGSKRPPSPPSPTLRPETAPQPRSEHLRRHLERQRQATPAAPTDAFDAPVPNETYPDDDPENPNNHDMMDASPDGS